MSEPAATIAVNTAVSAVVTTAAGHYILGASPDAIALGFMGALAASFWQADFDQPKKTYGGIAFGMLLAGWGTPAATDYAQHAHWISHITAENIRRVMPIIIGASIPLIGAPVIQRLREWLGAKNNA